MEEAQTVQDGQHSEQQVQGQPDQKSGCLKWALIGCGVLLILGILTGIGCFIAGKYLMNKGTAYVVEHVESEISSRLPEGIDREEFKQAFKKGAEALKEGRISAAEIQNLSSLLQTVQEDGKYEKDEVESLLDYLEEAGKNDSDAPAP